MSGPARRKRLSRRGMSSLIVVVTIALASVGCSSNPVGRVEVSPTQTGAFGHIHGLGIDATAGAAFVATHSGVYRLPPLASPTVSAASLGGPIAGLRQDTMGFVMVDHSMYASGHPDPAKDPSSGNLGLITSIDDGRTWQTKSLGGQTDFHDLDVFPGATGSPTVYGFDAGAGAVMMSRDGGATWSTRATIALRDMTVDSADSGTVYATTAEGLVVSRDGATTFDLVPGAPALYLIQSLDDPAGGALIGIDVKGSVWTKTFAQQWRVSGQVQGQVDAIAFSGGEEPVFLVADERGIVASSDLGATWRTVVSR